MPGVPGLCLGISHVSVLVILFGFLLLDTGTLVSHVTLRLLKPECALDKSWCQEELSVAVKRAVTLLHSHTITSRVGKGEPGKEQGREGQSALGRMCWCSRCGRCGRRLSLSAPHAGLPEAVALGRSLLFLAFVSSSEKWGVGPDGEFLSPGIL